MRLARKRRHGRKGPLDFRSTVRHSLSYGGVPAEPKFRYPRPSKPEIFVIADISGSVAAFARFTLHLVYAISNQFSKVRAFVFIDGIDEVTRFFEGVEDIGEAVHRVNTEADVVWVDGHSDYGHAFEVFWQRYGQEIGPKTTVLILGDARNNYHAVQAWVVKEIQQEGPPRLLAEPRAPSLLGHRRLDRRRVRRPLRRRLRVPQPAPARALRREPRLIAIVTRLVLIRHGESVARSRGSSRARAAGLSDLGAAGRGAARPRWPTGESRPTCSSPATCPRAIETAEILAPGARRPPRRAIDGAGSMDPGPSATGCVGRARRAYRHPDWRFDPYHSGVPGGETLAGFHYRVATRWPGWRDDTRAGAWSWRAMAAWSTWPSACSCTPFGGGLSCSRQHLDHRARAHASQWRLLRYNDAAHLAGLPGSTAHG